MKRDPDLRYATPTALADDLRRFLRHEPLAAGRPGTVRRFRNLAAPLPLGRRGSIGRNRPRGRGPCVDVHGPALDKRGAGTHSDVVGRGGKGTRFRPGAGCVRFGAPQRETRRHGSDAGDIQRRAITGTGRLATGPSGPPGTGLERYQSALAASLDIAATLHICNALRGLGQLDEELGNHDESAKHLQKAVRLCRDASTTIATIKGRRPVWKHALCSGRIARGIQSSCRSGSVISEGRQCETLLEKQADSAYKARLARFLILSARQRTPGSAGRPDDDKAVLLLRQAAAAEPKNAEFASDLGEAVNVSAVMRFGEKADNAATAAFKEAIQLQVQAIAMRSTLSVAHGAGRVSSRTWPPTCAGRIALPEAVDPVDDAIAAAHRFTADNPLVADGPVGLVDLLVEKARIEQVLNHPDRAIETDLETIRIAEALSDREPKNTAHSLKSVDARLAIAGIQRSQNRHLGAIQILDPLFSDPGSSAFGRLRPRSCDAPAGALLAGDFAGRAPAEHSGPNGL